MYAKIQNNTVIEYPYELINIQREYPHTSFPSVLDNDFLKNMGIVNVVTKGKPNYNKTTQKVVEVTPIYNNVKEQWEQSFSIESITEQEFNEAITQIITNISVDVQKRLDDFAATRYYDGILSLCTYANSTITKFKNEGKYGITIRDQTWNKVYQIFGDAQSGLRAIPTSYSEIESELPVPAWPN